ncbi:MAG TPA: hypothetical protein VM802_02610, partial [Chitinophaga sp.]|uniref:hypothetical protein n=1 Tax=Chitinophaga sp. TaxID=1869181 RepID=UPI002CCABB96
MIRTILLLICCALISTAGFCQSDILKEKFLSDSLQTIAKRVTNSVLKGRYMEGKLLSTTDTLKDWEGVNVSLYEYKFSGNTARVYMANADARKIATWIISACVNLTGKLDYKNSMLLIKSINGASNGQFPVKGIVYENGNPFIFKDGVTVSVLNPVNDNINLITDENIKETKKFGRIISTSRQEYNAMFP